MINDRALAETELETARRAVGTLLREMSDATTRFQEAEIAQRLAVRDVLNIGRAKLREEMAPLERKLAAYRQVINYGDNGTTWGAVTERLMSDPLHADLHVVVPDAPEPPPPPPPRVEYKPAVVRIARPVGDDRPEEVISEEQFYADLRAASRQPIGAMAEWEAYVRGSSAIRVGTCGHNNSPISKRRGTTN